LLISVLFVKIPAIIFKVLNSNLLFLNNIVCIYFCLQPSELNGMFNYVKECLSDFLIGKNRGSPHIQAYTVID
jgi:hypothetical protein